MAGRPGGDEQWRGKSMVKNKQPAPMQITAEQIMREASERQESEYKPPKQTIHDADELEHFQVTNRKGHEDAIRRNQSHVGNWIKYAKFEEEQHEYKRARSVYERALNVDHKSILLWLKYADMEMRCENINRARNVWERAVALLPRVDQFWLKYILMEEMIGNFSGARQIFERWMEWEPPERAWNTYINFELRHHEVDRARLIYQRFVKVHPRVRTWIKFAKFEHKHGEMEQARLVYQTALDYLGEDHIEECEELFIKFAQFETMIQEYDRARAIYKYALDRIPKGRAIELYKTFSNFEKQFGDKQNIEEVILNNRRFQFEEQIKLNAKNYDIWFDYIRLEESLQVESEKDTKHVRIREVFERAIANVPPANEKRFWRRYIYLWIHYAVYEELHGEIARAREIYKQVIRLIPHKKFSFSKIWIMYAHFEVRQLKLDAARAVLGQAIGNAPKSKIFTEYIDLESKLGNIDRVRMLYEKWLEVFPHDCTAWSKFAEMEEYLEETDRVRAIYNAAIEQPLLDLPELVWKNFIDFELGQECYDNVRSLYERLLERSQHVKVWVSYAQFEFSIGRIDLAREVYQKAYLALKKAETKEERVILAETWKDFEQHHGDSESLAAVCAKMPNRKIETRPVIAQDGSHTGTEEYYDYIFPDEVNTEPLRLKQIAQLWKKRKLAETSSASQ